MKKANHGRGPSRSGRPAFWGMTLRTKATLAVPLALTCLLWGGATNAAATMRSVQLDDHLCKTVGGGRFVPIPGFPGERIDRRLLPDIRWLRRRFKIFVTDGYSTSDVHALHGEHPIGLALDIVPYRSEGGSWGLVGDLARLAEPRQDHPRPPWRWVGWNGDWNHGRGNHLHLSWLHSETEPFHPARVAYTRICPEGNYQPPKPFSGGGVSAGDSGSGTGGVSSRGAPLDRDALPPPAPPGYNDDV